VNDTPPIAEEEPSSPPSTSPNTTPAIVGAIVAVVALVAVVWGLTSLKGSPRPATAAAPAASEAAPPQPEPSAVPTAAPTQAPPSAAPAGTCVWTPSQMNTAKDVGTPPTGKLPVTGTVTMVLSTNKGDIEIKIDRARTPCAAASFAHLASKNYFNGTNCHRLTSQGIFVLQCGDPAGDGSGGPPYQFADENLAAQADGVYERGVVAMANAGPDTNGSQFFINYKDGQLQPAYTPFGVVTKGMAIVDQIAAAGTDEANGPGDGRPKEPLTFTKVTFK
jgi:peptidyl-prolyl cis-trans isomerase B (cyclophilin B)